MKFHQLKILALLVFLFFSFERSIKASDLQDILNDPLTTSVDVKDLRPTQTVLTSFPAKSSSYSQPVTFVVNVVPSHLPATTPKGTVRFEIDGVPVANQALVKGTTKFSTSSIPASQSAQHRIRVVYSGDDIYAASKDSLDLLVFPANTTMTLISKPNPSTLDQPLHLTATVSTIAPGTATPEGSIQFQMDGAVLATENLDASGQATFSTSDSGVGSHTLIAFYKGDANFNSSSKRLTQHINKAETTTVLTSSSASSIFAQAVTFTAAVTSPYKTLTGRVQFQVDDEDFGNPILLNSTGQATTTLTDLPSGKHKIEANYLEEANFNASQASLTQQVNKANTTTVLSSSENPSVFGQNITFTATVTSETIEPRGSVQFKIDGEDFGTPLSLRSKGQSSITLTKIKAGSYQIEAYYLGDENFKASNDTLTQQVKKAHTTTTLTSSKNPSIFGQKIAFTATVTSETAEPSGSVQFKIDGKDFGTPLSLRNKGQVTITLTQMNAGSHQIEAHYLGNENFNASNDILTQQIDKGDTKTTLTSSENPSTFGQEIDFTATVTSETAEPRGSVQFKIDGKDFGTPLSLRSKGEAALNIRKMNAGSYQIEANYLEDANFHSSSASLNQQVNKAETKTSLTSSANPSLFGDPVTFIATVHAIDTPTGRVQFQIEGKNVGDPLALKGNSQVSLTIASDLKVGQQAIVALYSGDENFKDSNSQPLLQEVVLPLLPPTQVEGFQVTRYVETEAELLNILKWKPPVNSAPPIAYRIYRDSSLEKLVATIPADQELEFIEPVQEKEDIYPYFIVSVDASNKESKPVSITVVPKWQEKKEN